MSARFEYQPASILLSFSGPRPLPLLQSDPLQDARDAARGAREDVCLARRALEQAEADLAEAHRRLAHAMVRGR